MHNRLIAVSGLSLSLMCGAAAHADLVTATITADNHYAIYNVSGNTIGYINGNETGYNGSPGTYNWSEAESWEFETDGVLYIAAWSDDATAQGLLAQLNIGGEQLNSGHSRWEVIATDQNLNDGDAHPTALTISGYVANADANNLWEAPFIGGKNGVQPWGTIAGITPDANWMWKTIDGDEDPLNGGSGAAELLIFRISAVPTPGAAALVGLGGLMITRRRR